MSRTDDRHLGDNLQSEIDSAVVYEALADAEGDANVASVYRRLAQVERAHADFWATRLRSDATDRKPSARARLIAFAGKRFGPSFVLPILIKGEAHGSAEYNDQSNAWPAGMPADERSHARIVQAAAQQVGGLPGQKLAQLEGRHRGGGGNALRAAVLGANDGLVSNLSLVMGVAGAAASGKNILLAGIAGLVAGSCSMAMGEWLSVNSSREMTQRQIDREAEEMVAEPEMEKTELVLIYQSKGLDQASARTLADKLFESKAAALDTLAREELGVDPEELGGSAWTAAVSSFFLFATGAIFPLAPFLVTAGRPAVILSVLLSGVALVTIGAATTVFTGRGVLFSAGRQLTIGYAAALVTFTVGKLLGATIS